MWKQQVCLKLIIWTTTIELFYSDQLPLSYFYHYFQNSKNSNFALEPPRLRTRELLPQRLARLPHRPTHPPPRDDAAAVRPVLYRVIDPLYQLLAFASVTEEVGAALGAVLQAVFQQAAVMKGGWETLKEI